MKKTLSLLTLFALTACNSTTVIPGSTIKTRTKTIVYTDTDTAADTNLDSRVAVYPITPNLIEKNAYAARTFPIQPRLGAKQKRLPLPHRQRRRPQYHGLGALRP